jgi:hypothetical protein
MARPALHLPPRFLAWLSPYLAVFSRRSRPTAAALAVGALLAVGPRTVTNCLRALGLAWHPGFAAFHRVLNRNAWSGLAPARTLLRAVVAAFVPAGPIVIGVDHTLERRRGPHIGPAGRFYDASRRADLPKPTSRGLRWLSAMVLVEVPFAGRIWALPVLTALTPSKAWSERHGRRHRPVTEWARLVLLVLRRWLPNRPMVAVMDGEFAALELLHALRPRMAVIARLRQDARLFDPPDPFEDRPGRPARKGRRQPLLSARLADPATRWLRVVQSSRTSWRSGGWIEYAHGTALWHHGGKPIVPIRWVLVRYPTGGASRRRSCAPTPPPHRVTCWTASTAAGPWRPHTKRPGHTWVSRPNASGRIPRSSAPRRCCSACTAPSRSTCTRTLTASPSRRGGRPGTRNRPRPSPTRSRACATTSGSNGSSPRPKAPI